MSIHKMLYAELNKTYPLIIPKYPAYICHNLLLKINYSLKVVISGKYKNLNKITKIYHISLKFHRLLIFVILQSLQCKIEGHAV